MRIVDERIDLAPENTTISLSGGYHETLDHIALLNALGTFLPSSNDEEDVMEGDQNNEDKDTTDDYETPEEQEVTEYDEEQNQEDESNLSALDDVEDDQYPAETGKTAQNLITLDF